MTKVTRTLIKEDKTMETYEQNTLKRKINGVKPLTREEYNDDYQFYRKQTFMRNTLLIRLASYCFKLSKWSRKKGFKLIKKAERYYSND